MVTKSTGTAGAKSAVTFLHWKRSISWTDPGICSKSLFRSLWTEHADRPTSDKSWRRHWRLTEAGKEKLREWIWTKRAKNHPSSSPELQQHGKTRQSIFLTYLATWSRNIKHCMTRLLYLERYFRSTVSWAWASWARLGGRLLVDSYRDSKLLSTGRKDHPLRLHTWAIPFFHSFQQTPGSRQWSTFQCPWQEHDPTKTWCTQG